MHIRPGKVFRVRGAAADVRRHRRQPRGAQPLVNAIDPGIEIIRFDVPGIGGSPGSLLPYSFPQLALARRPAARRAGLPAGRRARLFLGWGAGPAARLPGRRPVSAAGADQHQHGTVRRPRRSAGDERNAHPTQLPERPRGDGDGRPGSAPGARPVWRACCRPACPTWSPPAAVLGYLHQLLAIGTWTSLPFLPFIGQPVLVISGDADPIVPLVNARIMTGLLPRSTLHVFSGDHLGIVTAATELGERTGRFLTA